jgi:hypothetical protein
MKEKYSQILEEVLAEIESALKEPKGMVYHQRRIAFSVSLGASTLIEHYLEKKNVLKGGAKIGHLWLKKKKENAKKLLGNQITCPIENIDKIDLLLDMAYSIEKERNKLAYGKNFSETELKKLIELFFALKEVVEND